MDSNVLTVTVVRGGDVREEGRETAVFTVTLILVCCFRQIGKELERANSMGLFLQKTNIIRDYREDMDDGRTW